MLLHYLKLSEIKGSSSTALNELQVRSSEKWGKTARQNSLDGFMNEKKNGKKQHDRSCKGCKISTTRSDDGKH